MIELLYEVPAKLASSARSLIIEATIHL